MPNRIFWEPTQWPGIYQIVWSTDSPFQLRKELDAHLTELKANGMTLDGGQDIPDLAGPVVKATFKIGVYINLSVDDPPVLSITTRPETQKEMDNRVKIESDNILRSSGTDKLLALGLTKEEVEALIGDPVS